MARSFQFGSLALSSGNYRVTATDAFSAPDVENKAIDMARTDGTKEVFSRYRDRSISVEGYITTASESAADTALDVLKAFMKTLDNLDVGYAGGTRRWNCRFTNLQITRNAEDINQMLYRATFYSPKPYAKDTTSTYLYNAAVTSGSNSLAVSVAGSYPATPIFTLTINSISPSGPKTITIGNPAESSYLAITGSFIAGDVITIDTNPESRSVKHNGVVIPSTGPFPAWAPGSGTLSVTDTATARNITVSAPYPPRYI